MATSHTKQPAGRCCLVALAAVVGVAQGVAQQGLIAPHCNPACGEGGECVAGWTTDYCKCHSGFGPGNTQSCCAHNCAAAGHGTCGGPNETGQCVCSDGYTGVSCTIKPPSAACDSALALA
jgi:hypothetical protein